MQPKTVHNLVDLCEITYRIDPKLQDKCFFLIVFNSLLSFRVPQPSTSSSSTCLHLPSPLSPQSPSFSFYLDLTFEEDDLEPLFSGSCWIGTSIWPASVLLSKFILTNIDLTNASVLELGSGAGLPSFIAAFMGAQNVFITEQPPLHKLLQRNIDRLFPQQLLNLPAYHHAHVQIDPESASSSAMEDDTPFPKNVARLICSQCNHHFDPPQSQPQPQPRPQPRPQGSPEDTNSAFISSVSKPCHRHRRCHPKAVALDWSNPDLSSFIHPHPYSVPCPSASSSSPCPYFLTSSSSSATAADHKVSPSTNSSPIIDYILVSDCVFRKLYGDSWKALAHCIHALVKPRHTVVLLSAQRRGQDDGLDQFLNFMTNQSGFQYTRISETPHNLLPTLELYRLTCMT